MSADSDTASVQETVADTAGVRKVFRATYGDSTAIEGREVPIHVVDDFDHLDYSSVYEGRSPRHANEISIGSQAAKSFGKQVGDTITVSGSSQFEDFLIVGLVQSVSGLGFLSELESRATNASTSRLSPRISPSTWTTPLTSPRSWIRSKTSLGGGVQRRQLRRVHQGRHADLSVHAGQ